MTSSIDQPRAAITDDEIRSERQRAARAGDHDLADLCEVALGQHEQTGGLHDPYTGALIEKSTARARIVAAINARSVCS